MLPLLIVLMTTSIQISITLKWSDETKKISTPEELKFLEIKLDVLIDEYQNVKVENASLQTKQDTLVREKANLLEKLLSPVHK